MSISFNVLECAYLGIPSIISYERFESWPEFRESILFQTTTWEKSDVLGIIAELRSRSRGEFIAEAKRLHEVMSIRDHCERILAGNHT